MHDESKNKINYISHEKKNKLNEFVKEIYYVDA
jgi:hypothetical protein